MNVSFTIFLFVMIVNDAYPDFGFMDGLSQPAVKGFTKCPLLASRRFPRDFIGR